MSAATAAAADALADGVFGRAVLGGVAVAASGLAGVVRFVAVFFVLGLAIDGGRTAVGLPTELAGALSAVALVPSVST